MLRNAKSASTMNVRHKFVVWIVLVMEILCLGLQGKGKHPMLSVQFWCILQRRRLHIYVGGFYQDYPQSNRPF